ncbi:MAG: PEP-CTERM sorting domain-containing protein [Desulfobacter postgatei]|uniref:PEP-CTERM sorting domain-containing protein n=1 Tax=Desulfobacter postgatei TaxID=2293 RepID=UPI0023F509CF|nr:PEP-CTERM sorting domain-containing protein [Desulfobacter postgatei]MDD4273272.1 PEP-CTERM sorting domain-containing protein [Desulfobacter postgatei]
MKKRFLVGLAIWFLMVGMVGSVFAYTFTPLNSYETDSALLVDNYQILINGKVVNQNAGFESGDLTGFINSGDVQVISNLGSINAFDGNYFALGTTLMSLGSFDWADLMTDYDFSNIAANDTVSLSITGLVLTNEDPTSASTDWVHYHYYVDNVLYLPSSDISSLIFQAAPNDTGFKWMTGIATNTIDITQLIQNDKKKGISIHLGIGETRENSPVPEPSTILLLGIGLAGLAGIARKKMKK